LRSLLYRGEHLAIFSELFRKKLRIASSEIERVDSGGQGCIRQGTELHDFRAGLAQSVQVIFIVEAESFVSWDAQAYRVGARIRSVIKPKTRARLRNGDRAFQELVQIDAVLR
jgi:hypothetical protein